LGPDVSSGKISPGGDLIVYPTMRDGKRRFFMLDVATQREIPLEFGFPATAYPPPVWSADGRYVIFVGTPDGVRNLYAQRIKDLATVGEPLLLRPNVHGDYLFVQYDGQLVYSTTDYARAKLFAVSIDRQTGQLIGEPAVINDDVGLQSFTDLFLSPDSQWLAALAVKGKQAEYQLYITRADGSEPRHIRTGIKSLRLCGWLPDGKSILAGGVSEASNGKKGHFRIDVATGAVEMIYGPYDGGQGRLSADGQQHVFSVNRDGASGLYLRSVRLGAEPRQILKYTDENIGAPAWSPDGQQMALVGTNLASRGKKRLVLMPAGGGEIRELAAEGPPSGDFPAWSPDGKFISCVKNAADGLWIVPAAGGPRVELALKIPRIFGHFWTPNGKLIISGATEDDRQQLWSLENYLPAE